MRYLPILFFLAVTLPAAPMQWAKDVASARALAAAEGKVVYVLITEPGCRWCRRFKHTTLRDEALHRRLGAMAVGVEVERGSEACPEALKAPVIPMHYFLAPDEQVLVKMPGYWNIEDFMSILDDVERKRH